MNSAVLSLRKSLVKRKERPSGIPMRMVLTYKGWPVYFFTVYATRRHDSFCYVYISKNTIVRPRFWPLTADDLWVLSPDHIFTFGHLGPLGKFTVRPGAKLTLVWKDGQVLFVHHS